MALSWCVFNLKSTLTDLGILFFQGCIISIIFRLQRSKAISDNEWIIRFEDLNIKVYKGDDDWKIPETVTIRLVLFVDEGSFHFICSRYSKIGTHMKSIKSVC